jgi:hypothetical protein
MEKTLLPLKELQDISNDAIDEDYIKQVAKKPDQIPSKRAINSSQNVYCKQYVAPATIVQMGQNEFLQSATSPQPQQL